VSSKLPDPFRLTVKVLHLAMLASIVMYAVVAWLVAAEGEEAPPEPGLVIAMVALGLGALVASLVVPSLVVTDDKLLSAMRRGRAASAAAESTSSSASTEQARLMAGAQGLMVGFILRLALIEVVALAGLVLSLMTNDPLYAVGFGAVALVFMAMAGFDEERLKRLSRRI
jgi:hypothetical protein